TTGSGNVAIGRWALRSNSTPFGNVGIGYLAGSNVISGGDNIFIGDGADCGSQGTVEDAVAIGTGASVTASNTFVFGNSSVLRWGFGTEAGSRAIKVGTSSSNGNGAYLTTGGTWTDVSDRNKKEEITELDKKEILQKINQLGISKWKYRGTENEFHI